MDKDYHQLGVFDQRDVLAPEPTEPARDVPQNVVAHTNDLARDGTITTREIGEPRRRAMGFDEALMFLKLGQRMQRRSWPSAWIRLREADATIYLGGIETDGLLHRWNPTHDDLLAIDWQRVEELAR